MRSLYLSTLLLLIALSMWLSGDAFAAPSTSAEEKQKKVLQVKVHRLIIDPSSRQPVVVLADALEERAMLIWVGFFEAGAIRSEIEGIDHPRPLTHDLLEKIIRKVDMRFKRITITHLSEGTFHASILLEKGGTPIEIDARPSDSIVLALKLGAPIFVTEKLFREVAVPLGDPTTVEEQYGLRFQELNPSLAKAFSYRSTDGVLVSDVREGSRAEKDGIKRGDILVALGGRATGDMESLRKTLKQGGDDLEAKIFRRGFFLSLVLHPE